MKSKIRRENWMPNGHTWMASQHTQERKANNLLATLDIALLREDWKVVWVNFPEGASYEEKTNHEKMCCSLWHCE